MLIFVISHSVQYVIVPPYPLLKNMIFSGNNNIIALPTIKPEGDCSANLSGKANLSGDFQLAENSSNLGD